MKEPRIGGKIENVRLNNHIVSVIRPKNLISYEKGSEEVEKLIEKIKKK